MRTVAGCSCPPPAGPQGSREPGSAHAERALTHCLCLQQLGCCGPRGGGCGFDVKGPAPFSSWPEALKAPVPSPTLRLLMLLSPRSSEQLCAAQTSRGHLLGHGQTWGLEMSV